MLSDREIEASAKPQNIVKIGAKLGLGEEALDTFGKLKAKIEPRLGSAHGANLILVTATNPTPYGEGNTTVTVGRASRAEPWAGFWYKRRSDRRRILTGDAERGYQPAL